ncbi:MAG TPA: hypothetical protein VGZ73_31680 [Bryobacteraceae bacterium]|jgi:hypothetical protein|nr:hypothetical protein [Bryobacteraceae bacterium]
MDPATDRCRASRLEATSAGLQAGMLGACWMLLWLGVSDVWQQRNFWTTENLMASAFYGEAAIRSGFAARTLSGLALYLVLYSLLGALLALAVGDRIARVRVFLVSLLFALIWYYFSFRLLWKSVLPLVALLHSAPSTSFGHLIYGAVLGRYPAYLPRPPVPAEAEMGASAGETESPAVEAAVSEAQSETREP